MVFPRDTSPHESSSDATPDSHVRIVVRRHSQQVVVRAGSAAPEHGAGPSAWTRSSTPTLIGLDVRERQDTLPGEDSPEPDPSPWSGPDWPDAGPPPRGSRRRPVVLREGLDDALVEYYRQEAQRILDSGLFEQARPADA